MTGAISKSQKWCSNSWVCSAIGPYTSLTPSWPKNRFNWRQAIVTKCSCFHFLGEEISSVFMAGCSYAESWWYADSSVDDRLRPCKHISLESPSHISSAGVSTRVGEQRQHILTCFLCCNFFFAIQLHKQQCFKSFYQASGIPILGNFVVYTWYIPGLWPSLS